MSQPPSFKKRGLKKRAEFLAVAAKGAKAPMPGLVMQLMPRADDAPFRVGFTVTKKVGNAVVRNRTKRRLRAAVRLALDSEAHRGFDMVVIGRDRTADRPFADLMEDVRRAVAKARRGAARDPIGLTAAANPPSLEASAIAGDAVIPMRTRKP